MLGGSPDPCGAAFTEIKAKNGPDALAFISSSKCTNEESYLMQKLGARGHRHEQHGQLLRYCQAPATEGLFRTVGYGAIWIYPGHREAGMVLIIGSNTARPTPSWPPAVKQAHKLRGQNLSLPICASTRWQNAPISFFSRTWNGHRLAFARSPATSSIMAWRKPKFLDSGSTVSMSTTRAWNRSHWSFAAKTAD